MELPVPQNKMPPLLPAAPPVIQELTPGEWADLRRAKQLLENPGLTARLAAAVGRPIEKGIELLPKGVSVVIRKAAQASLFRALELAVASLGRRRPKRASERLHKLLVSISGGVGGVFGLVALPMELPISTALMLRSIADIARSEGHDIRDLGIKLSCLEVFALGGPSREDDATESSYWAVRAALAKAVSEAASYLAERGFVEHSAPALIRFISAIASRFGIVVSEQLAAKAIPLVGAAGGIVVNLLFMKHFQDMARGHFIVKRLELRYGRPLIQQWYQSLALPLETR
jgi:hypothetical protein